MSSLARKPTFSGAMASAPEVLQAESVLNEAEGESEIQETLAGRYARAELTRIHPYQC